MDDEFEEEEDELQSLLGVAGQCQVVGCSYTDIDPRGEIYFWMIDPEEPGLRTKQEFRVCVRHWESVIGVIAGFRMNM